MFEIIAEPNRRAVLMERSRVLRETGFVKSTVDAQRRLYRLKPEPLQEVEAWLAPFRRFWSAHVDALERRLDHMESVSTNEKEDKQKTTRPNRERDKGETQ